MLDVVSITISTQARHRHRGVSLCFLSLRRKGSGWRKHFSWIGIQPYAVDAGMSNVYPSSLVTFTTVPIISQSLVTKTHDKHLNHSMLQHLKGPLRRVSQLSSFTTTITSTLPCVYHQTSHFSTTAPREARKKTGAKKDDRICESCLALDPSLFPLVLCQHCILERQTKKQRQKVERLN